MYCSRCGTELGDQVKFCSSCGLDVTIIGGAPPAPVEEAPPDELVIVREALQDEYEIIKELGRGGMAIVLKAVEKGLEREVAIKVLPASMGFDPEFVERFQREAKTAAKLEHPSIIPIYRVGKKNRIIFFAMKFLRGKSLADLVDELGALAPADLRKLLIETAEALGYAHKHGVVHRDIKPDNILLDDTGRAILTDFGIAKAASSSRLTGTGMAIGTPHYMSPEQARAQELDGRSDFYSLGVCAYQCLTGRVPFDASDAFSIGYKHITEPVPEPELETQEQKDLFAIIRKLMQKDPADRFADAAEVVDVLRGRGPVPTDSISTRPTTPIRASSAKRLMDVVDSETTEAVVEVPTTTTPITPMPGSDLPADEGAHPKKQRSGALVAAALLVIVGGGAGGYAYYATQLQGTPPVVDRGPLAGGLSDDGTVDVGGGGQTLPGGDDGAATTGGDAPPVATDSATGEPTTPPAPTTGTVVLTGLTRTSRVVVDGRSMSGASYELAAGPHMMRVEAQGRRPFAQDFEVTAGSVDTIRVRLPRIQQDMPPVAPSDDARDRQRDAANCDAPGPTYNANNVCFDSAPLAQGAPIVRLPADYTGNPTPVILWVEVGADGTPTRVSPATAVSDAALLRLAINAARQLTYNPAQKNGRPVGAWFQLQMIPRR
ncbi:MAG: protein kinase [Gemmatimonadales bacterium]